MEVGSCESDFYGTDSNQSYIKKKKKNRNRSKTLDFQKLNSSSVYEDSINLTMNDSGHTKKKRKDKHDQHAIDLEKTHHNIKDESKYEFKATDKKHSRIERPHGGFKHQKKENHKHNQCNAYSDAVGNNDQENKNESQINLQKLDTVKNDLNETNSNRQINGGTATTDQVYSRANKKRKREDSEHNSTLEEITTTHSKGAGAHTVESKNERSDPKKKKRLEHHEYLNCEVHINEISKKHKENLKNGNFLSSNDFNDPDSNTDVGWFDTHHSAKKNKKHKDRSITLDANISHNVESASLDSSTKGEFDSFKSKNSAEADSNQSYIKKKKKNRNRSKTLDFQKLNSSSVYEDSINFTMNDSGHRKKKRKDKHDQHAIGLEKTHHNSKDESKYEFKATDKKHSGIERPNGGLKHQKKDNYKHNQCNADLDALENNYQENKNESQIDLQKLNTVKNDLNQTNISRQINGGTVTTNQVYSHGNKKKKREDSEHNSTLEEITTTHSKGAGTHAVESKNERSDPKKKKRLEHHEYLQCEVNINEISKGRKENVKNGDFLSSNDFNDPDSNTDVGWFDTHHSAKKKNKKHKDRSITLDTNISHSVEIVSLDRPTESEFDSFKSKNSSGADNNQSYIKKKKKNRNRSETLDFQKLNSSSVYEDSINFTMNDRGYRKKKRKDQHDQHAIDLEKTHHNSKDESKYEFKATDKKHSRIERPNGGLKHQKKDNYKHNQCNADLDALENNYQENKNESQIDLQKLDTVKNDLNQTNNNRQINGGTVTTDQVYSYRNKKRKREDSEHNSTLEEITTTHSKGAGGHTVESKNERSDPKKKKRLEHHEYLICEVDINEIIKGHKENVKNGDFLSSNDFNDPDSNTDVGWFDTYHSAKKKNKKHKDRNITLDKNISHSVETVSLDSSTEGEFDSFKSKNSAEIEKKKDNKKILLEKTNSNKAPKCIDNSSSNITSAGMKKRNSEEKIKSQAQTYDELWEVPLIEDIADDETIHEMIGTFDDNYYVSEDFKQTIRNLNIIIDWEVPVLHTIETRLTAVPSKKQTAVIDSLNIEVKKGYFSEEESATIMKNFNAFCSQHDLPPDPRPFLKFKKGIGSCLKHAERVRFVQYLAKGLNNRLLCTVYRRFQNMVVHREKTGRRFSDEEDQFIIDSISRCRFRFVELGKILSRHPHSILKRYDILTKGKYSSCWDLSTCEKVLKAIIEVTLVVKIDELKRRHIHEEEWIRIAKKVGIYPMRLKDTWYRKLHPQLFIPDDQRTETVIQEAFYRLLDLNITEWKEVNWENLSEPFEGWTGPYLKTIIYSLRHRIPINPQENLRAFCEYALETLPKMKFRKHIKLDYLNGHLIKLPNCR